MAGNKADKKSLFDEFQIKGYWWLPKMEEKVPGILFYTKDETKLELFGTFKFQSSIKIETFEKNKEIVLGISDYGEQFTLLDVSNTSFKMSSGFNTETYSISSFIVGGLFNSLNEMFFHSLAFYPTYFSKWTARPQYNFIEEEQGKIKGIRFNKLERFSEYVKSINATIEENYVTNLICDVYDSMGYTYKGGFKITPDERKDIEWFRSVMFKVRDLYTLFIGHPTYFEYINFYGDIESQGNNSTRRKKYLFFMNEKNAKVKEKFHSFDVILGYRDIESDLNKIFNLWFEKENLLKTVVDLYLTDFYSDVYLETRFLNAVQSLEIYHRKAFNGKYHDDSEYEAYAKKILDFGEKELPNEIYLRLEGMLKHGNEYSLSKRLRELINQNLLPESKTYLFGNSDNRGTFVQQLVDTRNFLTHYDESDKKNILNYDEIFYAIYRLKALITLILFKEIGLNEILILSKIKESKKFRSILPEAKEILNSK
ncbi:HEPN domain-containing protein [Siminovitchia sp. 179-K 8D1 HS]|uniref:ApeA N-terminal domain 1-containing protein n=1 Tax=Siminovitchia sp. 179-K 8D1 HS TaxID=3142385 RepID=UPI0039A28B9A